MALKYHVLVTRSDSRDCLNLISTGEKVSFLTSSRFPDSFLMSNVCVVIMEPDSYQELDR